MIKFVLILSIILLGGCGNEQSCINQNSEPILISEKDGIKVYQVTHNYRTIYYTSNGGISVR